MDNIDKYKLLESSFFKKNNLRGYMNKYKKHLTMFTTRKLLWKYVVTSSWLQDEKVFIDDDENNIFYLLKMDKIYETIFTLNPKFSIDIYIVFNLDLIDKCKYIHEYLHHYINSGYKENRISCINTAITCDIPALISANSQLKHECKCIYDYILHFSTHTHNKITSIYDNTFTTDNNYNSAVKFIDIMKQVKNNKNISDSTNENIIHYETELLHHLTFHVFKNKNTRTTDTNTKHNNAIVVSNYNTDSNKELYRKYPFIFHKYFLKLTKPSLQIDYNVTNKGNNSFSECLNKIKIVAHLHCLHIEKFKLFYGPFIEYILLHFPIIIVTYSIGKPININNKIILIKIANKGMDIGGKIIAVDYLSKLNISYKYILFLHSKSDDVRRSYYFKPILNNMSFILNSIEKNDYHGYFPPLILNGDSYHIIINDKFSKNTTTPTVRNRRNSTMFDEFCSFLKLDKTLLMFPEGNNFILSYDTAIELYKPEYYNLLNGVKSFDAHWVMIYYHLYNLNIAEIYNEYKIRKLYGNNIETTLGHNGLADSQIEHVFERLVFNIIQKNKGKICILPFSQTVSNKTLYLENNINNSYMYGAMKITDKELILSNNIDMENTSTITIIACHTNTNLKIQCLIHNIGIFIKISTKIVICNSYEFKHQNIESMVISTYPDSINIIDFKYIQNDSFVCHSKWNHVINHYYSTLSNYHHFILTNDSYLYIKDTDELSNFIDVNYEMQTILISNEVHNHYTDFLRIYNFSGIIKINNFYKWFMTENKNKPVAFQDIINGLEMKSHIIFDKKNGLYEEPDTININFIEPYKKKYIEETKYPIIKIKAIQNTFYEDKQLPDDFDPQVYKLMHADLSHLITDKEIISHFSNFGMLEGRIYKHRQDKHVPSYVKSYLNKFNITL